ncbi:hypothetical protein FQA39_LY16447 [Lamprigera yunnana]|nr:hypothetical protein FQA39_LY16447 [Lamprigera yunnana]
MTICFSSEEYEQEVFLNPRNFNPHPYEGYESKIRANGNRGPVLFPTTPTDPDDTNGNSGNVNENRVNGFSIDSHPYVAVRKHKYKQGGRFHNQDEINVNNREEALKPLSASAEKVPKKSLNHFNNPTHSKKAYAFSYAVQNQLSGDDFSHSQKQDSKSTNGEYRVKLPDGRIQIVSYVADKNGYKADVKYAENENFNSKAYSTEQQIYPIQIVQNQIKAKSGQADYIYEDYVTEPKLDNVYKDYETLYHINEDTLQYIATPSSNFDVTPKYENQIQINPYLIQTQQKVYENIHETQTAIQINEQNFNNEKVEKFIGSTLATYTIQNSKGFQKSILSTISPYHEKYEDVNGHNFRFSPKQNHQFLYKK